MDLPATTKRVSLHTEDEKNRRIYREMEYRLWYFLHHPNEINNRLRGLPLFFKNNLFKSKVLQWQKQ